MPNDIPEFIVPAEDSRSGFNGEGVRLLEPGNGVDAGAAVLAHPPEVHCAEDGDGGVGGGAGGEGLKNVSPDDRVGQFRELTLWDMRFREALGLGDSLR